jgi:UDP-N-acetylmuramate: L-alanyl-gamma-D-glutamyl-meso-diaminopimelate ligase
MLKHVHIVGICGVATSALAVALNKHGIKVTGSDKGFYPPVSTYLSEVGIIYHAGWHPEKIAEYGTPDIIVTGGSGTSLSNPEVMYAKEHGIPLLSFAEALGKFIVKNNSIVTAGTWGKTTSSALLSFIMIQAGMKPSYFTGGLSLSHPTGAMSISKWSVVEGDEYQVAIWDKRPKFACYVPTHLLLTSVSWDHADLYPTEKDYFDAFQKLINGIPAEGLLLVCNDDAGVHKVLESTKDSRKCNKIITYGKDKGADYEYQDVVNTKNGLVFRIKCRDPKNLLGDTFSISSQMIGDFNAENITGCFAMAMEIGIKPDIIIQAISDFKGIRRRFEKRLDGTMGKKITVFDCHAPTPEKANSVLATLRSIYSNKIVAVYEPNIGGRRREAAGQYDRAFKGADVVIIPTLTKLKVAADWGASGGITDLPVDGDELTKIIGKTHANALFIEDDEKVVAEAISQVKEDDIIVFLGSHGFRGMIEEVVNKLK